MGFETPSSVLDDLAFAAQDEFDNEIDLTVQGIDTPAFDATIDVAPEMLDIVDYTVSFGGRTFTITEPDLYTITALLRLIGNIGMRSTKVTTANLTHFYNTVKAGTPLPPETMAYSLLSALEPEHFQELAKYLLFGGAPSVQKEAKAFFDALPDSAFDFDALFQAAQYRIAQSDNLAKALKRLPVIRNLIGVKSGGTTKAATPTLSA